MAILKKSRKFMHILLAAALVVMAVVIPPDNRVFADVNDDNLPEPIRIDKADFDTIPDVAHYYKEKYGEDAVSYYESVNGERRIQRINFFQYPEGDYLEVNGEVILDIPARDVRIWRLFGDVRFEGSASREMELYIIDPNGVETQWTIFKNGGWTDGKTGLYTNYTKMGFQESNSSESILYPWLVKDETGDIIYEGYKMRIVGNGSLRSIYHWEEEGVPLEFDVSAWTVLGGDKPVLPVTVAVYADINLSMNGVNKLPEEVFKRYHVNSGPIGVEQNSGAVTLLDEAYHKVTKDWGFIPGRGAFHFSLLNNYAGLKEDPNNLGYSDFSEVYEVYAKNPDAIKKFDSLYPTVGKDYVLTLDGWPRWTWEDPESNGSEHFGTPAYEHFDAAADAAAKTIKSIDTRFDGRGPKYVEVKNESTIPQEWWFFVTEPDKAWDYLAEFHNKAANAIKSENPDVLVGGPSSAFMYLEKNDFQEAREQLEFMDKTKDTLDWYSHHFYENSRLIIHDRENNPDGFLSGRLEAVLDLLNAHMVNTDNVKPIYITEEGTYNTAGTDIDYFQKLVAFNGYMLRFMDYSDSIGMLVPYLYPVINWKPNANNTFYRYTDSTLTGLQEEMTPLEAYVDMWKDYRGAFLLTQDDNDRVFANAVRYNDTVYVAVHNLNAQRVNLDLNVYTGDAEIASVKRKHFFLEKGVLTYEEETVNDLDNVYMRVQEMSVFEIKLDRSPEFKQTWERKFFYAPQELQPTSKNEAIQFTIATQTNQLKRSTLRIGFGKSGSGFSGDMTVEVNPGTESEQRFYLDLEWTNKPGDLLTFAEFELDPDNVLSQNTIDIAIPEDGGYITSVQLINYYEKEAPIGADTSSLVQPIADAKAKLNSIAVSETGSELEPGTEWVQPYIHDTLSIEVTKAEIVKNDQLATQEEITRAVNNLEFVMQIFEENTNIRGSSTGIKGAKISFEDEEEADYTYDSNLINVTIGPEGATDGGKALKAEFTEFITYGWDSSGDYSATIDFTASEEGWNLDSGPISFDVTNLENAATQLRVDVEDAYGNKGMYYFTISPNETRSIEISEFGPTDASWLTDGYSARSKAIDTTNLKKLRFYVFVPEQAPLNKATLAFDNIVIGVVSNDSDNGNQSDNNNTAPITPPVSDANNLDILINGKKIPNIFRVEFEKVGDQTTTTVTVKKQLFDSILNEMDENALITIPITTESDAVFVHLDGEILDGFNQKNSTIEVVSGRYSYKLPAKQLVTDEGSSPEKVEFVIKINKADVETEKTLENLSKQNGFLIVAPPVNFEVN